MSDSVRPHRRQPTRFPCPWDSPGKNTGVGCHFLLQCMKVKSEREVAQSCLTLSDPMDCSLPGSSVHGIFQTRVLESMQIYFLSHCDYLCFSFSTLPAPLPSPPPQDCVRLPPWMSSLVSFLVWCCLPVVWCMTCGFSSVVFGEHLTEKPRQVRAWLCAPPLF